jgi:hypothetical protein
MNLLTQINRPRLFAMLGVMVILSGSATNVLAEAHSEYSPLTPEACFVSDTAVLERYQSQQLWVQECPARFGYRVFVVSSDSRSWLELEKAGQFWSSEQAIVYQHAIGQFPNIADNAQAEWRLDSTNQPIALIFRVNALNPDVSAQAANAKLSRLYVFRLGSQYPCFLGTPTDNQAARNLADSGQQCR